MGTPKLGPMVLQFKLGQDVYCVTYAKHGICHICVCVCLFVTLQYCIKKAKHRITQITPHASP